MFKDNKNNFRLPLDLKIKFEFDLQKQSLKILNQENQKEIQNIQLNNVFDNN